MLTTLLLTESMVYEIVQICHFEMTLVPLHTKNLKGKNYDEKSNKKKINFLPFANLFLMHRF